MPEPRFNHSSTPLTSLAYAIATHKIVTQGTAAGDGTTTAKTVVMPQVNHGGCGIRVITDITVHNGGTLTVTIRDKTENGVYTTLLASAALAGSNQTNVLEVFPAAPVSANRSGNSFLGRDFEITYLVATAAVTFSSSVEILR